MDQLARVDALELRAQDIRKDKVHAFICHTVRPSLVSASALLHSFPSPKCNTATFKKPELCQKEAHNVEFRQDVPRYFVKCAECGEHTSSIWHKVPHFPCPKCKAMVRWLPASAVRVGYLAGRGWMWVATV